MEMDLGGIVGMVKEWWGKKKINYKEKKGY